MAAEAGCPVFNSGESLLGRVDAVSVVVPTSAHLEEARPLLRAGIHMLLEKPIASTLEEGRRSYGWRRRQVSFCRLATWSGSMRVSWLLAERIARPRFIEAHRMSGFSTRATDVDVVSDLMIHDIDIILSLVKSEITAISAVGTPVLTAHVDIANARLSSPMVP